MLTDIPVTNLDRAIKFYSAVFGKAVRNCPKGGAEYGLLPHEEQNASRCIAAIRATAPKCRNSTHPADAGEPSVLLMGDPRNVAHAKKVSQEKHHKAKHGADKKVRQSQGKQPAPGQSPVVKAAESAKPEQTPDAAKLEKSLAVLAKLKELEFHSRTNVEKLAELSLTIEDELKQKPFVGSIGDVYSAEEAFHSKISALIEGYQAECDRLKPPA